MRINPDVSRVLHVDMTTGKAQILDFDSRARHMGGSGLAAALYEAYGTPSAPWDDPTEPIIFAIGPLTGLFPVMTKVVCGFRSPHTGQWTESHAGGRLGLSLRFAGYDALMITGRASALSALEVGSRSMQVHNVHYLRGRGVFGTGRELRRIGRHMSGHRSTMRIGPAGENGLSFACINVDSFRHFGRLGSGAVMGSKNLKGVVVTGDGAFELPGGDSKALNKLYKDSFMEVTSTSKMKKYHDLGTPENLEPLNELRALPWRNLQATSDPAISTVTGKYLAEEYLLRKAACAGCPVGCIHIANLRQQFGEDHEYLYKQVSYDYELIFAQGTMLGLSDPQDILPVLDETESCGLDSMTTGVALAWATEALAKGIISEEETLVPLQFGEVDGYLKALRLLTNAPNEFWHTLGRGGANAAAKKYGGEDFACVLGGQEMAGYATGEAYYVSHALGFRHSHLDSGGYSYDQSDKPKDAQKASDFLVSDERDRVIINSMVGCMFARKEYSLERMQECLHVAGFTALSDTLAQAGTDMQHLRWKLKFDTGFVPEEQTIPKRFMEVTNWKGQADPVYLQDLRNTYTNAIRTMAGAQGALE